MCLRHQALEVVDESFAAVFRVLVMPADVDRLFRADLLTVAAEDAAELVDLEDERIAIALLVFAGHELDAVGWTHRGTQSTRHAFRLAVFGREHAVCATPARRQRTLLVGVLDRHLLSEEVRQRERHAFERRAHVARFPDRSFENLHADGHQSAPPSVAAGVRRSRSNRAARSLSRLRLSSREYAGLMRRPRSIKPNNIAARTRFTPSIVTANFHDSG